MRPSRHLLIAAFAGLLVASCSSGQVASPSAPPQPAELVPPAPENAVPSDQAAAPISDDVAPRRLDDSPTPASPASKSPQPAPSASAAAAPAPPASKVLLGPLSFISQTLNNCGPASVAEVLGFWGIQKTQGEVQAVLRGDGNPYGMTTAGVPSYISSLGLDVLLGTAGTQDVLKELLRAGFPVIVNQVVSDTDLEFHFRPIQGFDDERGLFISSDPLIGPMYTIDYGQFDRDWAYTGHRFIVIYPTDKTDQLNAALAGKWDPAYAEGGGQAQPWSVPNSGPAPITSALYSGNLLASGKYAGPVSVSLSATDRTGFGVAATSYSLDGQPVQLYKAPFTVVGPGRHVIAFHSVNFSGIREADRTAELVIGSGDPPVTKAIVDGERDGNGVYKGFTRLTLSASSNGSPLAKTTFSIDNGSIQTYAGPLAIAPGTHTINYGSTNQDGDVEVQQVLTLTVQSASGSTPSSSVASPGAKGAPTPAVDAPAGPPPGGYVICPVSDQFKAHKIGIPVAIQVRLCDGGGKNLSSPAVPLTLQSIVGPPTGAKVKMPSAFRYVAALNGYEADEPPGPANGTYMVYFTAAGDPAVHSVQFRIGSF